MTDMVFMTWSDHSFTRNDQRAGRCLRLHGDKEYAVVAVWGRPEHMTGLLELSYGAQQLKAVTQCIENTDGRVEATASDSFRSALGRQMQTNLTGIEFEYAEWARLCAEYTELTGKAVRQGIVHGGRAIGNWAVRQQTGFRGGTLSQERTDLCRSVGIVLERARAPNMCDEKKIQFLIHCRENNISTADKKLRVQWQGAERCPSQTLRGIKSKWVFKNQCPRKSSGR